MDIIQEFINLGFHPIAWIFYSGVFFYFIIRNSEPIKTRLYLKYYCIFMMLLAVEALIRGMAYMFSIGADLLVVILISYLIVSILILCFCILTLKYKFNSLITYNAYIYLSLMLVIMVVILPRTYIPLVLAVSLQISSVWGCAAAAMFGLWGYAIPANEAASPKKGFILKTMLLFCIVLAFCQGVSIYKYKESDNRAFIGFSPAEIENINNRHSFNSKELQYALSSDFEMWCDFPGNVTFVLKVANMAFGLDMPPVETSYIFDVSLFTPDGRLFERQKVEGNSISFSVPADTSPTPKDYIGKWRMKVHETEGVTPRQVLIAMCIEGLHRFDK